MYHLGKVVEVFRPTDRDVTSADSSVQATMRMWDENVLTMLVAPKLSGKIKEGQVVLVDYRPSPEHQAPVPTHIVIKVIEGKRADAAWKIYREVYEKQRRSEDKRPPAQSYIA